jgi:Flp pilus assembly protein CpaB
MQTMEKQRRSRDFDKVLSTRNGTLAVAAVSALLAGLVLMAFLSRYRASTGGDGTPTTVLVAKRLIEHGSSGDVLASEGMFQRSTVPARELKEGSITDPSTIKGNVASADIYPGEQLTEGKFRAAGGAPQNKLISHQRAIAIPTEAVHGSDELRSGDRVDVLASFEDSDSGGEGEATVKLLMRNVLVLGAAKEGDGDSSGAKSDKNVVVKAPDEKAAELAFAADNGKLWLLVRPKVGARDSDIPTVTQDSVLRGSAE